jgi:putative copper resistance protein D
MSESGWFDPLIWVRFTHFAATISVTGAVFFLGLVAEPAFREGKTAGGLLGRARRQFAAISWVGLAAAVISGAAWLVVLAAQIADLPFAEALLAGTPWTILTETDFGQAWTVRCLIAALLAASLPWLAVSNPVLARQRATVAIALAAALVGTLALAGHAAAGSGVRGGLHLAADVLHLIAAAAWLGALVPLALLLRATMAEPPPYPPPPAGEGREGALAVARAAVRRFSTFGIASVATLVGSGVVNTWVLAGSIPALIGTDYGRLLLAKIALFLVMLLFAAVNRLWLTPRLEGAGGSDLRKGPLRQLGVNTLVEAAVAVIILAIVSMLGTLPPGLDAQAAQ